MAQTSIGPIVKMRWPFASMVNAGPPIPGLTDHYLLVFYQGDGFGIANDIVVLNMDTLTCTVTVGPAGRPIAMPQFHSVSGLLYFGTKIGAGVVNPLCTYDFANNVYTKIVDFPTYLDGIETKYDAPTIAMLSEESPPRMFFGGQDGGAGTLCAWTEAVGETPGSLQNYGPLDDPGSGQNRYISSMQIDASYAYCALYDTGNAKKYLVIVTLATGAETLYWKEDGLKSVAIVRKIASPHPVHAYVTLADGSTKWYLLSGTGAPTEVSDPTAWGVGYFGPQPVMTGYVNDLTFAYTGMYDPEDIEDKHIRLGVTIAPAPAAYALAELTSLDTWAAGYCGLDTDNNLLAFLRQPTAGSVYRYNRESENIDVFCTPKIEGWSMYADPHREKVFFGGYPAGAFAIFDTTAAQSVTNPVIPPHSFTSKHYPASPCYIHRIDRMVDNSFWLRTQYVRTDNVYGEMLRYDPDTDIDTNILSPLFEDYELECSCPNLAGSMMVVSAIDASNLTTLFVMQVLRQNTEGHPITKMISLPVVGKPTEMKWGVVCVETGVVADANRFVVINQSTSPFRAMCINVATGQTIWDVTQSGAPNWPDRTTPQFAYGYVWFFSGFNMVKMDVATGALSNVEIGGVPILATSANYNEIIWDKVNKIMYFNHGSDKSVYRVEGIDGI